ncbi:MAG: xanthine dehydrogenase accessory protein XdhC [Betaproteobacteria bacterium]|nr:xanthine dehydrogenase accessory protein XdhC [Betaproteobacteria bacterium]
MSAVKAQAQSWLASGLKAIVIELSSVRGSVPREQGTRMLVSLDSALGTIGGGRLEFEAVERARAFLRSDSLIQLPQRRTIALGPSLGQCCGGSVDLTWFNLDLETIAVWPAACFRFELQIHGAGHVGQALVQALCGVPCSLIWIDSRPSAWPDSLPSHPLTLLKTHCTDIPESAIHEAASGAYVLIATHRHDVDERIADVALRRQDLSWVGMIGSKTKRARILSRLQQRGLDEVASDRLVCPIGLPTIKGAGSKTPAVIALSVASQILQTSSQSIGVHPR